MFVQPTVAGVSNLHSATFRGFPKGKKNACSSVMHSTTVQILTEVYRYCHNPSSHEF